MSDVEPDTALLLKASAGNWITDENPRHSPISWTGLMQRQFVIIGTGGSHDYLKDSTANQRFWSIRTPPQRQLTLEEARLLNRLRALPADTFDKLLAAANSSLRHARRRHGSIVTDEDPPCDGIHDTGATPLCLCTRCFPYGREARSALDEREDGEVPPDENLGHPETA
jgi:Virulence-associated protein E